MAALPDACLDTIFRSARTFNGYTDEPVGEDELHAIWELMKWGPTSANQLPARLVWCTSAEAKEKLKCTLAETVDDVLAAALEPDAPHQPERHIGFGSAVQ